MRIWLKNSPPLQLRKETAEERDRRELRVRARTDEWAEERRAADRRRADDAEALRRKLAELRFKPQKVAELGLKPSEHKARGRLVLGPGYADVLCVPLLSIVQRDFSMWQDAFKEESESTFLSIVRRDFPNWVFKTPRGRKMRFDRQCLVSAVARLLADVPIIADANVMAAEKTLADEQSASAPAASRIEAARDRLASAKQTLEQVKAYARKIKVTRYRSGAVAEVSALLLRELGELGEDSIRPDLYRELAFAAAESDPPASAMSRWPNPAHLPPKWKAQAERDDEARRNKTQQS